MNFEVVIQSTVENAKVSIITPVYNVEAYLEETLESLLTQTLTPIELILVDDGSTDRSADIIIEYAKKYSNITFAKQKNAGPGQARNRGIELATGEFISFVDSDDLLPQNALETMYTAAKRENAEVVTGASLSFNSTRTWYIASHYDNGVYTPGEKRLVRNPELLFSLGPCNKMFKTDLVKSISFPADVHVTEDHPFIIEAYLRANKIYTVDKVIYKYRSREEDDNLSLSQIVRVNSPRVMKNILTSLSYSDALWNNLIKNEVERIELMSAYYHRIIIADMWPALMSGIRNKDSAAQKETFELMLDWIKSLDRRLFNKVPSLARILTFEVAMRYEMLSNEAKQLHLQWLKVWDKLADPGTMHSLKNSNKSKEVFLCIKAVQKNSISPLENYTLKRRLNRKYQRVTSRFKSSFARHIVFRLAKMLPVKNTIVFASNKSKGLDDSYPFVYEQIKQLRPSYKVVDDFFKKRDFKGLCRTYYQFGRAKYVILNDYHRQLYKMKLRKETEVIQMWHACGAFKKFGHSAVGYADSNTTEFENRAHQSYTKVVVSSKEVVPFYAEAFKVDPKNVLPLGLPRTDVFYDKEVREFVTDKFLGSYPLLKNKKVITYAPTFRGNPKERKAFNLQLDLSKMAQELSKDYVLVLKLHPAVKKNVIIPDKAKNFVIDLSDQDINEVLMMTDILISDYSSLVFEYATLERPLIFYAYDYENYMKERAFFYDYEDFVPGPISKTTSEIIELVQKNEFDLEKVKEFNKRFNEYQDGQSSKRFVETLIK
jgi:CDP-glycerol glycerophosphotransferase (TagB/SpsB family)/glycosyltransferase involved in cell wall biosynthesis